MTQPRIFTPGLNMSKLPVIPPLARMATVGIQHSPNSPFSGGPDTYVDLVKLDVSVADTWPSVESALPVGTWRSANTSINVTLRDGFFTVNTNTIAFRFDGTPATAAISKAGPLTSIQYYCQNASPPDRHTTTRSATATAARRSPDQLVLVHRGNLRDIAHVLRKPSGSASTRGFTFRTVAAFGNNLA